MTADLMAEVQPLIPSLRRYARSMLRDRDLADDLVQDCLERVIVHWDERRRSEDSRQWVFAIAHNLAVNKLRQETRRGMHVAIEDVDEATMVCPANQEDRVRHNELMRALDTLPLDQRSVVLMISVEDLSYAEVAEALGVPVGTVTSRLARGREKLQRALDGESARAERPQGTPMLRRLK